MLITKYPCKIPALFFPLNLHKDFCEFLCCSRIERKKFTSFCVHVRKTTDQLIKNVSIHREKLAEEKTKLKHTLNTFFF